MTFSAPKTNGTVSTSIIHAQDFNQFLQALTGVMTDQAFTLAYQPSASGSTPIITIIGNGNAPYVQMMDTSSVSKFLVDSNGNITGAGTLTMLNNQGIYLQDTGNVSRLFAKLLAADNDIHLYTNSAHGNLKITKADASGDIAIFNDTASTIFNKGITVNNNPGIFNAGLSISPGNASAPSTITVGVSLGIKNNSGTKLAEVKSDGKFVISGSTYYTTPASPSLTGSGSFDGFDIAEVIQLDGGYPSGSVVCPGPNDMYTLCRHDNCPMASVISSTPGVCLGSPDEENNVLPLALIGRVNVKTAVDMTYRTPVVSDGRGGVRPVLKDEIGNMLGFTLNSTNQGMVGIQLRSMSVRG